MLPTREELKGMMDEARHVDLGAAKVLAEYVLRLGNLVQEWVPLPDVAIHDCHVFGDQLTAEQRQAIIDWWKKKRPGETVVLSGHVQDCRPVDSVKLPKALDGVRVEKHGDRHPETGALGWVAYKLLACDTNPLHITPLGRARYTWEREGWTFWKSIGSHEIVMYRPVFRGGVVMVAIGHLHPDTGVAGHDVVSLRSPRDCDLQDKIKEMTRCGWTCWADDVRNQDPYYPYRAILFRKRDT